MVFPAMRSSRLPRITAAQWAVLMLLEQGGGRGIKDIARALRITSSAATQLVNGLEHSGYVKRTQRSEDRRGVSLTLSKKTAVELSVLKRQMLGRALELFAAFSDREFEQYALLNKKLVRFVTTHVF